jgi:hypothetical protein
MLKKNLRYTGQKDMVLCPDNVMRAMRTKESDGESKTLNYDDDIKAAQERFERNI